jgi:Glycosyltransferase family 87
MALGIRGAVNRTWLLVVLVAILGVVTPVRLAHEAQRLVAGADRFSAWDLKLRHREVRHWFAGEPVYRELAGASYPPASYPLLWPLLGWLPVSGARWLWALTLAGALGLFIRLLLRESGAETWIERAFIVLLALSMDATASTVALGQLTIHLLLPLLAGLLLLARGRGSWRSDLCASLLILGACVKPTITLPFCWLVLFLPRRLRPALLVALEYAALTAFAVAFQQQGLPELLHDWRMRTSMVSLYSGHLHLRRVLVFAGLGDWALPAALGALAALGAWLYRYRRADPWLLIGITAIVARVWTYHRLYDDVLFLFPIVALFQIAKRALAAGGSDVRSELLLGATVLATLIPGYRMAYSSWADGWEVAQAVLWTAVLLFLAGHVRSAHHHPSDGPGRREGHAEGPTRIHEWTRMDTNERQDGEP